MRRIVASIVVAVSMVSLAGCGSSGSTDKDQISHVVVTWSRAFADGNGDQACRLMTNEAARHLAATRYGSCAATVRALASSAGGPTDAQLHDIKVKSVTVRGHQALVAVVGGTHPFLVVKRGGSWYVDHVVGR